MIKHAVSRTNKQTNYTILRMLVRLSFYKWVSRRRPSVRRQATYLVNTFRNTQRNSPSEIFEISRRFFFLFIFFIFLFYLFIYFYFILFYFIFFFYFFCRVQTVEKTFLSKCTTSKNHRNAFAMTRSLCH